MYPDYFRFFRAVVAFAHHGAHHRHHLVPAVHQAAAAPDPHTLLGAAWQTYIGHGWPANTATGWPYVWAVTVVVLLVLMLLARAGLRKIGLLRSPARAR
jgi:hypothetical protein